MKNAIRVFAVAVALIALVASLATVSATAASLPDYQATVKYDWELQFAESNGCGYQGWGANFVTPAYEWQGAISLWRGYDRPDGSVDENGNHRTYSYDPEQHAVTVEFWGSGLWQALQVNTAQDATADLLTASASYHAFQIYFPEDGSFPGLKFNKEDSFCEITEDGVYRCWTRYPKAERLPGNQQVVGQLQPGWNWITVVGITQYDENGEAVDLILYFCMQDPREGFTGAELEAMPQTKVGVGCTFGNIRKATNSSAPNQFIHQAANVGTTQEPTYLTFKGLTMGTLSRQADAFMLKVREMDAISVDDDPAAKYALYKEATALLESEESYIGTDELNIYRAFRTDIEGLVADLEDACSTIIDDIDGEEAMEDKYEILADIVTNYYIPLSSMSAEDFPMPEDLEFVIDEYNESARKANAALTDALAMTAGIANGYFAENTDIAALIGDIKSKISED